MRMPKMVAPLLVFDISFCCIARAAVAVSLMPGGRWIHPVTYFHKVILRKWYKMETSLMLKPPPPVSLNILNYSILYLNWLLLPNVCGPLPFRPFPAVISILFLKPGRKIWGHVTERFIKLYCLQYFWHKTKTFGATRKVAEIFPKLYEIV